MALSLSERCLGISPSVTLAIDTKAKELRARGEDVIGFGAGEPDFDTPEYIRDAAKRALDEGVTRYTPVAGTVSLRKEIARKLKRDNGLDYTEKEIIVTNGAKQALFNALSVLLNPGDEVIIPAPAWVSYPEMVGMAGGKVVSVSGPEESGFLVTAEDIRPFVTEKTKCLILNTPGNPTGCVWTRGVLEGIARLAVEKGFYIISDEIYEKLIYDGLVHVSIASLGEEIKAQTIVVNGVSKSYAMTGWRIGYAAGPAEIIRAMTSFQSHATSNANSIAQYAAAVALTNGEDYMKEMVREFDRRRKLMHALLTSVPGLSAQLPEGAFYMMLNMTELIGASLNGRVIRDSMDFAEMLLESEKVAVVPGEPFGAPGHVRLSYATGQDQIRKGAARIADFVGKLTIPGKECA